MKNFIKSYISLGFIGYSKISPGTLGSLIAILLLFPFFYFNFFSFIIYWVFFLIIILISIFTINSFNKEMNEHDSKIIVIDEFIGIYFVFLFYDIIFYKSHIITCIFIFLIFRFFDIIKIFPANLIDKKMLNSLGVILDDIIAGIYTVITIYLINAYF
tara:strand:+ start:7628 stop:8101 length:474 start_codon:yes stop_codon:yes gene_type:complete